MLLRLLFIVFWLSITRADILKLEIEDFPGAGMAVQRANASNGLVAHLLSDNIVHYYMCVHSPVDIIISDIYFTNQDNNKGDHVSVFIDGNRIGTFNSQPKITPRSRQWNNIRSSGQIGDVISLDYGQHLLALHVVNADEFGIELDAIDLDYGNFSFSNFACDKYCFENIHDGPTILPISSINKEQFTIRQHSKATVCSEEENVKVGFYHDSAESFEIKATRPKYQSCSNNRDADFRGCKLASPAWSFENVTLNPEMSENQRTHRAALTVDNAANVVRVAIVFDMSRFSVTRGQGESRTAGRLFTKFGNILSDKPVTVTMSYLGKSGRLETAGEHVFTIDRPSHTWRIPDNTWEYNSNNKIVLSIRNQDNDFTDLSLDELRLEKRNVYSRAVKISDDGQYVFEGIYQEPKWLKETGMTINVNDRNDEVRSFDDIYSLRLYMKKPYDDGYSQIFVINDDGHTRIQPVTPHGFDWTPFGSSLIIGPNRATNVRPFASIKSIKLQPSNMRLRINYNDGSRVVLRILATPSETTVKIVKYTYGEGRKRSDLALITFLSTWIEDGYAYADRMAVDGAERKNLLDRFNELTGNRVNFYRKCISRLNTQSPDIEISVTDSVTVP